MNITKLIDYPLWYLFVCAFSLFIGICFGVLYFYAFVYPHILFRFWRWKTYWRLRGASILVHSPELKQLLREQAENVKNLKPK